MHVKYMLDISHPSHALSSLALPPAYPSLAPLVFVSLILSFICGCRNCCLFLPLVRYRDKSSDKSEIFVLHLPFPPAVLAFPSLLVAPLILYSFFPDLCFPSICGYCDIFLLLPFVLQRYLNWSFDVSVLIMSWIKPFAPCLANILALCTFTGVGQQGAPQTASILNTTFN